MSAIRLKETHPLMIKLGELFDHMDRLGIVITFQGDRVLVFDESTGHEYTLLDIEQSLFSHSSNMLDTLPPQLEYKLCKENNEN